MRAVHLQTEYLSEPMGIDILSPRFYWYCEGGIKQTAYQIIAEKDGMTVWDSGKVLSDAMRHIRYEGKKLESRDCIEWSVQLWDENDVPGEVAKSRFEMGLLKKEDWTAEWIAGNVKLKKHMRYPVDCFRRKFSVKKELRKARLYITACGLYEARMNGEKVGKFCLAPGCTDYRKRLQYQTYDVTEQLIKSADAELTVQVADGWYRGSVGCFGATNVYGRQTKLLCQLEMIYADGTQETIVSNEAFSWSDDGPVRFADLKDGEIYDARKIPSYTGNAVVVKEEKHLVSGNNVYPVEKEHFPARLIITPSGKKVLDFGQNIAGFLSFTIQGKAGQKVNLRMGEILDENGEFTQKNIQTVKPVKEWGRIKELMLMMQMGSKLKHTQPTPKQEIEFICSGKLDYYKTAFAVSGFRYALIETEADFHPSDFEAIAVYSDMEQTGAFTCSNAKVNQFFENTKWSMKGNFLDIPTDCPTRERLGWTGDAQVFFETGAYLMNTASFFRKWMLDMEDGKMKNGVVPAVVPYAGMRMMYEQTGSSVGWGDAAVYLPYRYWKCYGDVSVLEQMYPMARAYAMYAISNTGHTSKKEAAEDPNNSYVYEKGTHLGEWLEPKEFQDQVKAGSMAKQTEVSCAYFYYAMTRMKEIASELGKKEDEELFAKYAAGSKKAYQELFLKDGIPDTDRQAKLVRPLALGLADGDEKRKVSIQKRLAQAVKNRKYKIGTGFLSTPFVLQVLTEAGESGLAYKMLEQEQAPGWLYEVEQGATTVWEDWEGTVSHNHYSPGAVCQWLFDTVAGIRISGENHFVLSPIPGGTLTHAEASYISPFGMVKSSWKKTGTGIEYCFEIPANTTAEIVLTDGTRKTVRAGIYQMGDDSRLYRR